MGCWRMPRFGVWSPALFFPSEGLPKAVPAIGLFFLPCCRPGFSLPPAPDARSFLPSCHDAATSARSMHRQPGLFRLSSTQQHRTLHLLSSHPHCLFLRCRAGIPLTTRRNPGNWFLTTALFPPAAIRRPSSIHSTSSFPERMDSETIGVGRAGQGSLLSEPD